MSPSMPYSSHKVLKSSVSSNSSVNACVWWPQIKNGGTTGGQYLKDWPATPTCDSSRKYNLLRVISNKTCKAINNSSIVPIRERWNHRLGHNHSFVMPGLRVQLAFELVKQEAKNSKMPTTWAINAITELNLRNIGSSMVPKKSDTEKSTKESQHSTWQDQWKWRWRRY